MSRTSAGKRQGPAAFARSATGLVLPHPIRVLATKSCCHRPQARGHARRPRPSCASRPEAMPAPRPPRRSSGRDALCAGTGSTRNGKRLQHPSLKFDLRAARREAPRGNTRQGGPPGIVNRGRKHTPPRGHNRRPSLPGGACKRVSRLYVLPIDTPTPKPQPVRAYQRERTQTPSKAHSRILWTKAPRACA